MTVARNGRSARAYLAAVVAALAFTTAACSGGSNPTSPTPAPGTTTVVGVNVTATPAGANAFQLTATARFSDSTTKDVTSTAAYESSNQALATVAPGGLVTVVSAGEAEIRATYQAVSGTVRFMTAKPVLVTLSGIVREVQPTEHPIQGARVQIAEGPDKGKSVMSDASGAYQFTGLQPGPIVITSSVERYQPWRVDVMLSADQQMDAWLVLVPATNLKGETATARCNDGAWSWALDRASACSANGGISYFVCPGPFCKDLVASK